jgi:transposase
MAELITMTQKELSRYEVIKKLIRKEINGTQAAKQVGLSIRQVKRIKARVIKEGAEGLIHKQRGKSSNRKIPKEKIQRIEKLIKEKYYDFGPTLAKEKLEENHHLKVGKETLRLLMINWGLWKPRPRKKNKEYRSWRQRKEYYGEMEQFDGSYHSWFEDRAESCCLLASIDDATGIPTKLKFVHWEGVREAFDFWKGYLLKHGKPLSIYLDRHSTYKQNQKSVFDDPKALTQFQRAMERDLEIKIIHAHSPQAKGRIEIRFNNFQDRLVKELRLAGISTIPEANRFVEEVFIPKFSEKFGVLPQKKGDLHRPLTDYEKENLDRIFSIQESRFVNNDFTVRYKGKWFQLLENQPVLVRKKERVQIEERISGQIFISLRGKYLNYTLLPERPKKIIEVKIPALTRAKSNWKPPADHPWRRAFIFNPTKSYQTSSRV